MTNILQKNITTEIEISDDELHRLVKETNILSLMQLLSVIRIRIMMDHKLSDLIDFVGKETFSKFVNDLEDTLSSIRQAMKTDD